MNVLEKIYKNQCITLLFGGLIKIINDFCSYDKIYQLKGKLCIEKE